MRAMANSPCSPGITPKTNSDETSKGKVKDEIRLGKKLSGLPHRFK